MPQCTTVLRTTLLSIAGGLGLGTATGGCGERCEELSSPLSYATDIAPLMTTYCTECHTADKSGKQRQGAPITVDYDTLSDTSRHARRGAKRMLRGDMPPSGTTKDLPHKAACVFDAWRQQGTPP